MRNVISEAGSTHPFRSTKCAHRFTERTRNRNIGCWACMASSHSPHLSTSITENHQGNTGAFVMARGRRGRRGRRPGHVCTDIIGTWEALRPSSGGFRRGSVTRGTGVRSPGSERGGSRRITDDDGEGSESFGGKASTIGDPAPSVSQKGRRDRRLHGDLCRWTAWWTTLIKPLEMVRSLEPRVSDFVVFYPKKLAGGPGFEPGLAESESAVLPLNYPPAIGANHPRGAMWRVAPVDGAYLASAGQLVQPLHAAKMHRRDGVTAQSSRHRPEARCR